MQGEQLDVVSYVDDPGGLSAVGTAITGKRAIVFVRSRRRAEELAHGLSLPVHHGSLASASRSDALKALARGSATAVVATSTLEMGLDIADLDLIVHDGAPSSPASYLQRLGRSGRQTGHRRMTFTCGGPDELVLTLGVVARARRGDVGDLPPQRGARLVLGQQALAIALQQFISSRHELRETLRWTKAFDGLDDEIDVTIEHLLAGRFLQADGDQVVLGPEGNRRFGGPTGVARLLATFKSSDSARVLDEAGYHLADADWSLIERHEADESRGLVLGGRAWTVVRMDREQGVAVVRAAGTGRAASWRGPVLEVERATWEAVREVLAGTDVPMEMDERAHVWLTEQRGAWAPRLESPVRSVDATTMIDSFAGAVAHRSLLAAMESEGTPEGASCMVERPLDDARDRAASLLEDLPAAFDAEARRLAPQLDPAHPELVAHSVLVAEARAFHVDEDGVYRALRLLVDT